MPLKRSLGSVALRCVQCHPSARLPVSRASGVGAPPGAPYVNIIAKAAQHYYELHLNCGFFSLIFFNIATMVFFVFNM